MKNLVRLRFEYIAAGLFVAAWLLIMVLRAVPLGGKWGPLDPITNWLVFLWVSSAVLGIISGGWLARKIYVRISPCRMNLNLSVTLLSMMSCIGAGLIIVEFAFVRGYGFNTPVSLIRILEVNRGMEGAAASLLSGPGRLMMPAILPAFLIVTFQWRLMSQVAWLMFGLAAAAFLFVQIKYEGGRWFLFGTYFALAFLLFGDLFRKDEQGKFSFRGKLVKIVVFLGLYGAILLGYSASVFESRFAAEGQEAAYKRFATDVMKTNLGDLDGSGLHPTARFFWLYATHGVNELNNLMSWDSFSHSLGAFQFPQVARIADKLLGTDLRVEYKVGFPNAGLYTTMIGASFVDFGKVGSIVFGVLFSTFLGFYANLFGRQTGITFSALAFPSFMTVAALSPIISLVNHMWPVLCWSVVAYLIATLPFSERRRLGCGPSHV